MTSTASANSTVNTASAGCRRRGHQRGRYRATAVMSVVGVSALALTALTALTSVPTATAATASTTASSSPAADPTDSVTSAPGSSSGLSSGASCPAVFGLALQGTGQSSPGAPVDADTGFLSELFSPLVSELGADQFAREYIPYDSSMGGFALDGVHPTASASYTDSVAGGLEALETRAAQIIAECDSTLVFPVGFSQGADVVDRFAAKVGSGDSEIPADRVAGAVVFGSPLRAEGADLLPGGSSGSSSGSSSGVRPAEVVYPGAAEGKPETSTTPGTSHLASSTPPRDSDAVVESSAPHSSSASATQNPAGSATAGEGIDAESTGVAVSEPGTQEESNDTGSPTQSSTTSTSSTASTDSNDSTDSDDSAEGESGVEELTATPATGAGLLPASEHIHDYGALAGRVGQFCTQGDLVCSTPADAPLARVFSHAVAQVDSTGDPFKVLSDLGDAFSLSPVTLAADMATQDVSGTSLSSVRVDPDTSISQRLENAAVDPVTTSTDSAGTADSADSADADTSQAPTSSSASSSGTSPSATSSPSPSTSAGGPGAEAGSSPSGSSPSAGRGVDESGQKARAALSKLGVLGVDAVVQIAKKTITADTIAQVAAVGLVNPAAGLTVLGTKVAASATEVLAPVGVRAAESVFNYAKAEVSDNKGLIQMATDVTYWRHAQNHTSYGVVPVTGEGTSAIGYTGEWITHIATSSEATEDTEDTEETDTTSTDSNDGDDGVAADTSVTRENVEEE